MPIAYMQDMISEFVTSSCKSVMLLLSELMTYYILLSLKTICWPDLDTILSGSFGRMTP